MTNAYGFYGGGNAYMSPQPQMANFMTPHSPYLQHAIALNNQAQMQMQPLPQQQQQQIATQPPIMQNIQGDNRNSAKMLYVGNKEEATAHPVDLIYNTPTFFYNRGTNEVYMKQYDGNTGNAKFKVYVENGINTEQPQSRQPQPQPQVQNATIAIPNDNAYMNELKMIRAGIEGLYRYLNYGNQPQAQSQNYQKQQQQFEDENEMDEEEIIDVDFVTSSPQKKQNKGKVNGK